MRARRAVLMLGLLAGCRAPASSKSEDAGARFVVPPALACVPRDSSSQTRTGLVQTLAEACVNAQPVLAQPVLDAIARAGSIYDIPAEELSRLLLRAARAHPAYDWDCDIPDEAAGVPWQSAGRPPNCGELKRDSRWLCVFDAGTGMWLDTLLAVAAPYPDAGATPTEELIPAMPAIVRNVVRGENIMGNRCTR